MYFPCGGLGERELTLHHFIKGTPKEKRSLQAYKIVNIQISLWCMYKTGKTVNVITTGLCFSCREI